MHRMLAIGMGWILAASLARADSPAPEVTLPASDPTVVELTVDLTCVLPTNGPAVEQGVLVARLYEYQPRKADSAATEIARVTLAGISHRAGEETVLRFPCTGRTLDRQSYYLTAVVYPAAEADAGGLYFLNGFQRVLSAGDRQELTVKLMPVEPAPEPATN